MKSTEQMVISLSSTAIDQHKSIIRIRQELMSLAEPPVEVYAYDTPPEQIVGAWSGHSLDLPIDMDEHIQSDEDLIPDQNINPDKSFWIQTPKTPQTSQDSPAPTQLVSEPKTLPNPNPNL